MIKKYNKLLPAILLGLTLGIGMISIIGILIYHFQIVKTWHLNIDHALVRAPYAILFLIGISTIPIALVIRHYFKKYKITNNHKN